MNSDDKGRDVPIKKGKSTKPKITSAIIIDALKRSKGIITGAAGFIQNEYHVKMTRSALSKRINRNEALRKELDEITESALDFGEKQLYRLISEGDKTALLFFLKCKGKHRGWTERQEVTGANGSPVAVTPNIEVNFSDKPVDGE